MGKREDDKFPSNTTVKPSHNQILGKEHQVIEIITLHSGKNVDNKVSTHPIVNDSDTEVILMKNKSLRKVLNLKSKI